MIPCEVLITLVILIACLEPFENTSPQYQVLDFFAGAARVSRASRGLGESAAAFDIGYHTNPRAFDINSPSGLVFLNSIQHEYEYSCASDVCMLEDVRSVSSQQTIRYIQTIQIHIFL